MLRWCNTSAGDNLAGKIRLPTKESYHMDFDTDKYTSKDPFDNVMNNPTLTVRVGETYSFVRSSTGSPLRILTAADCPDCANGIVPSVVPSSSVVSSDNCSTDRSCRIRCCTNTSGNRYIVLHTDGSATSVGQIIVKYQQCTTVGSSGTVKLTKSYALKNTITLSGDLLNAAAARRDKLRGGNKIVLSEMIYTVTL